METDVPSSKHPQQLFFDNVSPATRLLEKRRQMYEVQDALETHKARYAKEEEQFRKKEEQLRAKDLQLQHQLFRFNKFLQDNEAKRRRAETRAAEEAAQIKQKDEEIDELERQLEENKLECKSLELDVDKNTKYEEFLERVKETDADNYSEIQDLVTRYETLESANKDLMDLQTQSEKKIEDLRSQYNNDRKEQEREEIEMRNKMDEMRSRLDEKQKARQHLQHEADAATQESSRHSLYFGQILMSVENIHIRCKEQGKGIQHNATSMEDEGAARGAQGSGRTADPQQEEPEDSFRRKKDEATRQLKIILSYLKDFKDITDQLRKGGKAVDPLKQRQAMLAESQAFSEEDVKFVAGSRAGQERSSQQSGSQGNTRDLKAPPSNPIFGAGASATIDA
jgi:chromosome segregation ATPase